MRAALLVARTTPNTTISLSAGGSYELPSSWIVQGDGTRIAGNGATLVTYATHSGAIDPLAGREDQGTAIVVTPQLGADVPFDLSQRNGLWRNPAGNCGPLQVAAGGTIPASDFQEHAPNQDADGYPTASYSLFAPYLAPARNIIIENLSIRFGAASCDSALYVTYATRVSISNIATLNLPSDLGGTNHGDMWSDGSQDVTFSNCKGPAYIQLNSSTDCTVTGCTVSGVTFEEMSRQCYVTGCVLSSCRTDDILCSDITYDSNTFTGTGDNVGCIWGGTRIRFTNNKCAGTVWLGGTDTRDCTVTGNTGPTFDNFAPAAAGNVLSQNSPN